MSVFKHSYYRGEAAKAVLEVVPEEDFLKSPFCQLLDFHVGKLKTSTGHCYEGSLLTGIRTKAVLLSDYFGEIRKGRFVNTRLIDVLGERETIHFGLSGAYKLIHQIFNGKLTFHEDIFWANQYTVAELLLPRYLMAAYVGPRTYDYNTDVLKISFNELARTLENAHMKVIAARYMPTTVTYRKFVRGSGPWPDLRPPAYFKTEGWLIYRSRNVVLFQNALTSETYVMTSKDLGRLSEMLRALALTIEYAAMSETVRKTEGMLTSTIGLINIYLALGSTMLEENVSKLCRAADCHYHLWLAENAKDIGERNVVNMHNKIEDEALNKFFPYDMISTIVRPHKLEIQHDLMKIYKFMHVTDLDPTIVLDKLKEKHMNANEVLDNDIYNEFKLYRKRQFIRHYHEKFNKNPGAIKADKSLDIDNYETMKPETMSNEVIEAVDLKGALTYEKYHDNELAFIKDKVCATSKGHKKSEGSLFDKNYLLYTLRNDHMSNRPEIISLLKGTTISKHCDVSCKPEAKKAEGRPFMMAPAERRWLLSELEANIANFIRNKKGSFTGRSYLEKQRLIQTISRKMALSFPKVEDEFIMSFDLAAFSPHFPTRVKKDMFDFWKDIYNEPDIDLSWDLFNTGTLRFEWANVSDEYQLKGNDLEGFNGRMNTDFHVDLMAFALYKVKRLFPEVDAGQLAVLIDDGLLRLGLTKATSNERIWEIVDYIAKIYKDIGIEISWDKTLISRNICIFLNEVIYQRAPLYSGLKSFIRIGPDKKNPLGNFLDEVAEITSKVSGAISSGCHPLLAAVRYIKEVIKTEQMWIRNTPLEPVTSLVKYITPPDLGGYGIVPLQALIGNPIFDANSTGLSMLRTILAKLPSDKIAKLTVKMINRPKTLPSARAFFRKPNRVVNNIPKAGRKLFNKFAETTVKQLVLNKKIKAALDAVDLIDLEVEKANIIKEATVNPVSVKLWYEASPFHFIDNIISKFANSSTLYNLMSRKIRIPIHRKNKQDLRNNFIAWKQMSYS